MKLSKPSQATRAYLYRIATALGLLAGAYGYLSDAQTVLILGLVATILGTGTASLNTSRKPTQ